MSNTLEQMTIADLKEYCEEEGIEVVAKSKDKPLKAEFISAITEFEKSEADKAPIAEEKVPVVKKTKTKELTRNQKKTKQIKELTALKRVIVTSNQTNQTKTQGIERVAWGNRLVGYQVDNVMLGRPWHVREGALRNLEGRVDFISVQDFENNKVTTEKVPAFIIQRLPDLTKTEIEKLAKKQTIRNSSIDSLI